MSALDRSRFEHGNFPLFPILCKLVLGCFDQRERFLASFTRGDVLLPLGHFLERKISLVIGGQRFRVGAACLCRAAAQMLRKRAFKFRIAIVRRHGALLS